MRNASKRLIATAAISALSLASLVGVSSSASAASEANTFTVTAAADRGGAADRWEALVNAFNKANPTYKAKYVPDESDNYGPNLATKLRAGGAADVMRVQPGDGAVDSVRQLVRAKYIIPLTGTLADKAANAKSATINVGGKVYAASTGQNAGNIVANFTLMQADGVTWPKTFASLLTTCKTARSKGHLMFVLAGSMWPNAELLYSNISGGTVYAKDESWNALRNAGKTSFANSAAWRTTLERIVQMKDAGCFQDGVAAGTFDDIDANFIGGKSYAAFIPGALSVAFSYGPMRGKTLKTMAFPGNAKVTAESNYALAINAKSKKQAAAKKFISWVASAAGQKVYCDVTGAVPLSFTKTTKLPEQYSEIAAMLKAGKTFTHPKTTWSGSPAVTIKIGAGIQGLLTGQTQVGKVLKTADATW